MNLNNNFLSIITRNQEQGGSLQDSVTPILNKFYEIGGIVIPVIIGVVALLIIVKLILLGLKLAQTGDDPEERSRIIKGMIWWGIGLLICIAAVASIATVFNILKDNKLLLKQDSYYYLILINIAILYDAKIINLQAI